MYRDRSHAGRELAEKLQDYRGGETLVLALPRGGVEVGYEIAEALDAELDVLIVRKLGAPGNPELGLGAIASHGARYVDERTVRMLHVTEEQLRQTEREERAELERRQSAYRDELPAPRIEGRTVILVDDGVATGGTARAAIRAVRGLNPSRLILAVPVAPPDTARALAEEVDQLVCPQTPPAFHAISQWYDHFGQTSDETVVELLRRRRNHAAARGPAGGERTQP